MPADNPLAAERDCYQKTAIELNDLIQNVAVFAEKFKSMAVIIEDDRADISQIRADAQVLYRDLAILLELAARLAHPQ